MEERTIKVYPYSELSDQAKQKVIKKFYDINTDYEWYDYIIEAWNDKLKKLGYFNTEIAFSGFSPQRDGASFTGKVNILDWLKAHKQCNKYRKVVCYIKKTYDMTGEIKRYRWHHYVYENTTSIHVDDGNSDLVEVQAIGADIEIEMRELNKEICSELDKAYDYLTSKKAIVETIEANDYKFTETGEFWRW